MDKDLGGFFMFLAVAGLLLVIYFSIIESTKSQVSITAMEQGYCSSAHPSNNSLVIWNKCKEEK